MNHDKAFEMASQIIEETGGLGVHLLQCHQELARLLDHLSSVVSRTSGTVRVLEIGTRNGASAWAMAKTFDKVEVWTYDIDTELPKTHPYIKHNRVHSLHRDDLRKMAANYFDFAFVDGAHHHEAVVEDLADANRLCKPGSPIVIHDFHGGFPGVISGTYESGLHVHWENNGIGFVYAC